MLANRLREILDKLIAEEQSAFVPGRLVGDNVLTAYVCIHSMNRRKGKQGGCTVKIDMMKAYDRVGWVYLQGIMQKLGFEEARISLVMRCVSTVSFQVKVNGELLPPFIPSRGLRQGDPISPYLFFFVWRRVVMHAQRAPWISHFLFVNDCMIFMQANHRSAARLNDIMHD